MREDTTETRICVGESCTSTGDTRGAPGEGRTWQHTAMTTSHRHALLLCAHHRYFCSLFHTINIKNIYFHRFPNRNSLPEQSCIYRSQHTLIPISGASGTQVYWLWTTHTMLRGIYTLELLKAAFKSLKETNWANVHWLNNAFKSLFHSSGKTVIHKYIQGYIALKHKLCL